MEEIRFIEGAEYSTRSACDHNTVFNFTVIRRSAKFLTLLHGGKPYRVGIKSHDGAEYALPFGTYSMAPVIRAERKS